MTQRDSEFPSANTITLGLFSPVLAQRMENTDDELTDAVLDYMTRMVYFERHVGRRYAEYQRTSPVPHTRPITAYYQDLLDLHHSVMTYLNTVDFSTEKQACLDHLKKAVDSITELLQSVSRAP